MPPPPASARRLLVTGRVQGVGFRPFVYRLALRHSIAGSVRNRSGQVEIHAEGSPADLEAFTRGLIEAAPPLARPVLEADEPAATAGANGFAILESAGSERPRIHLPPDQFACADCLAEMRDPRDRRYRYPFINCTQCGPRYTLIAALPYDRPNTAMARFPLCPACEREYLAPADRRFHAEPVACAVCGPSLTWREGGQEVRGDEPALAACVAALHAGRIVAVKGIGGYHLLCDARSEAAVAELRRRKPRPHKPLAVMLPQRGHDGLAAAREYLAPSPLQLAGLADPARPIVLCPPRPGSGLAAGIAPGLAEIGVMLPYSPLHHLLLDDFGGPLVATSGNLGGEPVITAPDDAEARLTRVADAFLHHDRPILRPADDAVYREIAGALRPLRPGRGVAPLELTLSRRVSTPLLAVGGHMKSCIALAFEDRVVVSPHIGDLDSVRGLEVLARLAADLQGLYDVRAEALVCDAHPGYASTRWAEGTGLPLTRVYHHQAHASALYEEWRGEGDWLVFAWDGTGYGEDGTLWGGEALVGRPARWRRVASLRPFRLPGSDKAGREPWRNAAALCWEAGLPCPVLPPGAALVEQAWARGLNAPVSSAAGRLFDAAAALALGVTHASFEGQGPMQLEAAARGDAEPLSLPLAEEDGLLRIDWAPLLALLLGDAPAGHKAAVFHASLAAAVLEVAQRVATNESVATVGLTGGVFQNRLLSEAAARGLEAAGFAVRLPSQVPCNDAGIAFGQVAQWLYLYE